MDSLYEHVRDEGDPIQGGGGVANSFSWPTRAEKEKIAPYQGYPTTADMSRRLRGTLDPLEDLPPELSTLVIAQALPPQDIDIDYLPSPYPSRLIELTTVSKKWQSVLFSTPILWSELYIDERQEDFLATLSVFVRLSSNVPVKLFLCDRLTGINWTGLASVLLPAAERVTNLHFVVVDEDAFEWVANAVSNLLERLCHLPGLKEVNFDTNKKDPVSLYWIESFGLPSTVNFNGFFQIELPESCWGSGTRSRFFDVTKCTTLSTLGRLESPLRPNLLLFECSTYRSQSNIISSGATLLQLENLAERLTGCNCFEQVVHTATFTLHRLQVKVDLSQIEDLLDCLRMLMHLQDLELQIGWEDRKSTRYHIPSDIARLDLKKIYFILFGGFEHQAEAQKPLGDLFSAIGTLYPGVEEVHLRGSAWMGFELSYLESLQAPKSLVLEFESHPLAPPSESITLQSVQRLEMRGIAWIDRMSTPSLLSLVLQPGSNGTTLDHASLFPRGLRSLAITLYNDMGDFNLTSLDCPDLRDLYLKSWPPPASWGHPRLSNLVRIKVKSYFKTSMDSSSNQLCTTLLRYPWRLPSLRELHFATCVDWDVLFLMLKRRNCDKSGVQRIDTVTLPFVPFGFHRLLVRLLAGETVELPSLISLSLEATREVIFDASVSGCFACMKHMRPGCTAIPSSRKGRAVIPTDQLYPTEDPVPEALPREVQDWLSQRRALVDIWKASYEEFAKESSRRDVCDAWRVKRGGSP